MTGAGVVPYGVKVDADKFIALPDGLKGLDAVDEGTKAEAVILNPGAGTVIAGAAV